MIHAGLKGGVDAQIAYQNTNPNWILPGRYYAADVVAPGGPSIRFHVAHTSCFVEKVSRKLASAFLQYNKPYHDVYTVF